MALAAEGKIQHTIETISLEDINENIDLMRDNKIVGRAVVTFQH
jgi:propanol-preferring alcohol dehydrogenase